MLKKIELKLKFAFRKQTVGIGKNGPGILGINLHVNVETIPFEEGFIPLD
jgi:hypothetical protein